MPFPCAAALLVASGRLDRLRTPTGVALLAGSALIGFNYVYYAFFGCGFVLCACVVAHARRSGRRSVRAGLILLATTVAATALNLAPSFYVWSVRGRPLIVEDKLPLESETYGLKLRHMFTPLPDHAIGLLRQWSDANDAATFPLETENETTRLGLFGTVGFVLVLWRLLVRGEEAAASLGGVERAAGLLTIVAFLWATVGGFGSLFNLLIPDIRAYNRIFPFVHFFALVGLAAGVDRLLSRLPASGSAVARRALAGLLLALGVFDQRFALGGADLRYARDQGEIVELRRLVESMESLLPPGARVFELPVASFPANDGIEDMRVNDPGKPYLVSRTLRWSYPAFEDGVARWQRHVGGLPLPQMAAAAREAGFTAVLIDRLGYADRADGLLASPGVAAATILDGRRYVALDLRRLPAAEAARAAPPEFGAPFGPASAGLPACQAGAPHAIERVGAGWDPYPVASPKRRRPTAPRWGDITVSGWAEGRGRAAPGPRRGPRDRRAGVSDVLWNQPPGRRRGVQEPRGVGSGFTPASRGARSAAAPSPLAPDRRRGRSLLLRDRPAADPRPVERLFPSRRRDGRLDGRSRGRHAL
ncbi:MAG: hypothetical protein U0599_17525 [Vicinamibacteria bacterium]